VASEEPGARRGAGIGGQLAKRGLAIAALVALGEEGAISDERLEKVRVLVLDGVAKGRGRAGGDPDQLALRRYAAVAEEVLLVGDVVVDVQAYVEGVAQVGVRQRQVHFALVADVEGDRAGRGELGR